MEQRIRQASDRAEFTIVVAIAFGYFILVSVVSLFAPPAEPPIGDAHLKFLLVYEVVLLTLLSGFLSLRGWDLQRLGLRPDVRDTVIGIGLVALVEILLLPLWVVVSRYPELMEQMGASLVAPGLGLGTVIAISIVNPVFEEVLVTAYVITALKKTRSAFFAINVSVAIRLAYHLYQGAAGVLTIIPLGLVFAIWFARTGRVWPLVVAHAIFDFWALMVYR